MKFIFSFLLLLLSSVLSADVVNIAQYNFNSSAASLVSSIQPTEATVSDFGNGGNVSSTFSLSVKRFGADENYSYATSDSATSSAQNLAGGEYLVFSVTSIPKYFVKLNELSFKASRNGGGGTINQLDVYVSINGAAFQKLGSTLGLSDTSNPSTTTRSLTSYGTIQSAQFAFVFFNGTLNRGYLDDVVLTGELGLIPSGTIFKIQ